MLANARVAATVAAADMDRAKAWYRDTLGLEPAMEEEGQGALYRLGDTMLLLYPSEYAGTNQATSAGFWVDDFDDTVGALRDRGVEFLEFDFGEAKTENGVLSMPDGQKGAWFKDSEGNILAVSNQDI
jgi:catechol 2,3-dioxygenase-like lactoylglutathione lyase family enzyme